MAQENPIMVSGEWHNLLKGGYRQYQHPWRTEESSTAQWQWKQLQQQRNDATTVGKSQRQRNSVAQQNRETMAAAKTIADENDGCNSQQKPSPNLQPRASTQAEAKATEKISPTSRQAWTIAEAQNLQTIIDLSPYCHNNSHVRNHLYRCVRKYRMAKVAGSYIACWPESYFRTEVPKFTEF